MTNNKPKWKELLRKMPRVLWPLAPIEYIAGWWFWLWRSSYGIRFIVEWSGALVIMLGAIGFFLDVKNREEDRATRNAQLVAGISNLASSDNLNAQSGISAQMELLARENVAMRGIVLSETSLRNGTNLSGADMKDSILGGTSLIGVNFQRADLSESTLTFAKASWANFEESNLSETTMIGVELHNANLKGANLTKSVMAGSDFRNADLENAIFTQTDIGGADLTKTNVTQYQIDQACISIGYGKTKLPEGINMSATKCKRYK